MLGQDTLGYYRSWLDYRRWFLRVPGVQACVAEDGRQLLSTAFGLANQPAGEPLTERHLFRIASHSKTFTAVVLLRLVERGRLRLDDPLANHLAELAGTGLAGITLRELLGHGGGVIRDSEDGDFWQFLRPYPDREQLLAIASRTSAAVQPRNERFKYSNIGYGLLGLVIERVTDGSFSDAVEAEILQPLELADLGPELPPGRTADFAAGHSALSTAADRTALEHVDTRSLAPATGFFATAAELVRFYSALLPGDDRLLSPDSQRQLRHWEWDVKAGESGYGLGVQLNRIGEHELYGHSGGYPGHITRTFACPSRRTVVSVLTNAVDGPAESLAVALFRLLDLAASATHQPATDGTRFVGRFSTLWGVQDVALLDGRLFGLNPTLANPADDAVALEVLDEHTLKMVSGPGGGSVGEPVHYEFGPDGSIRSVRGGSGMSMRPFVQPT